MKLYMNTICMNITPFLISMFAAYLVGSFVNVSWSPADWERDARVVTSIWGLCFGIALHTKLTTEGLV